MEGLHQENRELCEQVATLRSEMEHLNAMVETLVATQAQTQVQAQVYNQIHPPFNSQAQNQPQVQTTMISEIISAPVPIGPTTVNEHRMPNGYI